MYHCLPSIDNLGSFHLLAIVNSTMQVLVSSSVFSSLGCISRAELLDHITCSYHEKNISDKPKLRDILQNNWLVIIKNVKEMKGKERQNLSRQKEERYEC